MLNVHELCVSYGGIRAVRQASLSVTESTIIAKNIATLGTDVAGQLVAKSSLLGNIVGATLLTGSATNVVSVDPLLDVLANNGGPTQTHALKAGSPAIGAGFNPASNYRLTDAARSQEGRAIGSFVVCTT